MIKIQEHLNSASSDADLNILALRHWDNLNKKNRNNTYQEFSLIKKCSKYYLEASSNSYIKQYANNRKLVARRQEELLNYFLQDNHKELKRIILAKPNEFESIKLAILRIVNTDDLFIKTSNGIKQTEFGKLLSEKLFNYSAYRQSNFCIEVYNQLNLCTCPYCNDNRVKIVKNQNSSKETAYFDLDHFYPKSQNPFFALSFFNLIPSCKICNSTLKGDKEFSILTHIHPYHESFNELYKFEVSTQALSSCIVEELKIEKKIEKNNDQTLIDFNIKNRYNDRYNDRVTEIESLIRTYKNYYKTSSPEELQNFIFGSLRVPKDKNNILKRINGKLLRDIALQIDKEMNFLDILE